MSSARRACRPPMAAPGWWPFSLAGMPCASIAPARRLSRSVLAVWLCALAGLAQAGDPGKGGVLYAVHCAACHGTRGEPVWPGAPDFRRPGALLKTDSQFLALLKQGRGLMPAYLAVMKEREMRDLMAFLRTLS